MLFFDLLLKSFIHERMDVKKGGKVFNILLCRTSCAVLHFTNLLLINSDCLLFHGSENSMKN